MFLFASVSHLVSDENFLRWVFICSLIWVFCHLSFDYAYKWLVTRHLELIQSSILRSNITCSLNMNIVFLIFGRFFVLLVGYDLRWTSWEALVLGYLKQHVIPPSNPCTSTSDLEFSLHLSSHMFLTEFLEFMVKPWSFLVLLLRKKTHHN